MNTIYFVIGASGSGKTVAVKSLEQQKLPDMAFCYFDSIGVPSFEEMVKQHGSADEWQRLSTHKWVKKAKEEFLSSMNVILDGQARPAFIEEACKENGVSAYKIILIDCSDDVRNERLNKRGHPELADDKMMNWAKYLREQCQKENCTVLDNTNMTIEESAAALKQHLN